MELQQNSSKRDYKDMAKIVDKQNENDKKYVKMSDDFENSIAFKAACDLIFKAKNNHLDILSHFFISID